MICTCTLGSPFSDAIGIPSYRYYHQQLPASSKMLFKYLRGVGSAVRRPLVYDVGRQSCISPPLRRAQHFYSTVEKPLSYADFSLELPKVSVISRDIAAGISENILVLPFFQGGDEFKAEKLVAAIPSTAPSAIRQILVDAINMVQLYLTILTFGLFSYQVSNRGGSPQSLDRSFFCMPRFPVAVMKREARAIL